MLDQENQQQLLDFLRRAQSGLKVLWMVPGDDCSSTGFLMKVEDALDEHPPAPIYMGNFLYATSLG